jgi:hypothetical protein
MRKIYGSKRRLSCPSAVNDRTTLSIIGENPIPHPIRDTFGSINNSVVSYVESFTRTFGFGVKDNGQVNQ